MSVEFIIFGFLVMLGLMLVGIPVAISMALIGVTGGVIAYGIPFMDSVAPVLWSVQNDYLLTAIPLFVLLGEILLRSGLADQMYVALAAWLGRLPGGLLHTNIATCALFSATSGSSVATAATVGTVSLPSLQARNYKSSSALGTLAAGGTLGILIPPSVNLIIYGSMTNNSIGKLFLAGIIPGLVLVAAFMAYIAVASLFSKSSPAEVKIPLKQKIIVLKYLIPPFVIFGIIMGSLYSGLATATESAALGVIAALLFVLCTGRLNWALLQKCFVSTARTSGMVLLVITGAFILNLTVSLTGIAETMSNWVSGLGLSTYGMLLALVCFYLILGMFMDVLSMQVATIPITYPMAIAHGIDPIWFGIFIILMCEIALITPPVGMNLFVVQGIRPDDGSILDVMKGVMPYVIIMTLFVGLVIAFPTLVTWLPYKM